RRARKIRYRLEWLGLKAATKFLPLLSRKACYRLALLLGSLGAMLDRRGRRVALSNLRVAFGDEISSERRAQIVRESYQHFARTMLDFFWSPRLTSQNFSRYVAFETRGARARRSSTSIASRCPAGVTAWFFIPGLNFPPALRSRKWRKLAGTSSSRLSGKIPPPGSGCTSIGVIARWRRIRRRIHSTRIFRRISSAVSMKARAIFRRCLRT